MTEDADRVAAMQRRLAAIAQSLDDLEQRRRTTVAALAESRQPEGQSHVAALRAQLSEAEAELNGLRIAMANRGVIERAKGMLMVRLCIDEEAAFEHLRQASMRLNRRVADVAADVVRSRAGADVAS